MGFEKSEYFESQNKSFTLIRYYVVCLHLCWSKHIISSSNSLVQQAHTMMFLKWCKRSMSLLIYSINRFWRYKHEEFSVYKSSIFEQRITETGPMIMTSLQSFCGEFFYSSFLNQKKACSTWSSEIFVSIMLRKNVLSHWGIWAHFYCLNNFGFYMRHSSLQLSLKKLAVIQRSNKKNSSIVISMLHYL